MTYVIFTLLFLLGANTFHVSINFLALIPLFVGAALFELPGGAITGFFGLPINYILFLIMGHPDWAPESLFMAWLSGLITGSILGYFSGFYKRLQDEIERHAETINQKNLLVKEMHHRVKNHLSILIGLMEVEAFQNEEGACTNTLLKRMQSIALVHDKLQNSQQLDHVDMSQYLTDLVIHLQSSLSPDEKEILLDLDIESLIMPIQHAVMLGLLVNEVVTNSYKYAFIGRSKGKITILLKDRGDKIEMSLGDDGSGFNKHSIDKESLGLSLINSVIEQLQGLVETRQDKGTVYRFVWSKNDLTSLV